MIYEKIVKRRTIRKFTQEPVSKETIKRCLNAARLSPSGMNRQPLKYVIVNEEKLLESVFSTTHWAGYLPDYEPSKQEMPRAYIVVLLDKRIKKDVGHDAGIAVMSISMVATEEGLGSCILGAIDRPKLKRILKVPEELDIVLAVALGHPAEEPVTDEVQKGDIKYWPDEHGNIHVPKRELKDICSWNSYT
jgi:nitroreductase